MDDLLVLHSSLNHAFLFAWLVFVAVRLRKEYKINGDSLTRALYWFFICLSADRLWSVVIAFLVNGWINAPAIFPELITSMRLLRVIIQYLFFAAIIFLQFNWIMMSNDNDSRPAKT